MNAVSVAARSSAGVKIFEGGISRRGAADSHAGGSSSGGGSYGPPGQAVPPFPSQLQQSHTNPHANASSSRSGDVELGEIQREVERLRRQSAAILQSTAQLSGP